MLERINHLLHLNIDSIIKNGTYFSQAISSGTQTVPSVSSLFTSLYPFKASIKEENHFTINPNVTNFISVLRSAGYETHAVVAGSFSNSWTL